MKKYLICLALLSVFAVSPAFAQFLDSGSVNNETGGINNTTGGVNNTTGGVNNSTNNTTNTGSSSTSTITLTNPLCPKDNPNCIGVPGLIARILTAALGIVGSLALLMFIYGGFTWMLAAGNAEAVKRGKDIFIWATIGLVIIFSSYGIIKFIFQSLGV